MFTPLALCSVLVNMRGNFQAFVASVLSVPSHSWLEISLLPDPSFWFD